MDRGVSRVLFLDLDGVLNRHDYDVTAQRGPEHLDPTLCHRLEAILKPTQAHIVISSAWRYHIPIWTIQRWLHYRGAPSAVIIGRTPMGEEMGYTLEPIPNGNGAMMWAGEHRGKEITSWLLQHKCDRFVILEDSADLGSVEPWCVRTHPEVGLEDHHVQQAIQLLGV